MSRKSDQSLDALARIRESEEHEAAKRLSAARQRLDQERQNLMTVERYMADYANGATDVSDFRLLANGRQFLLKLEHTVRVQRENVLHAEQLAESAHRHWAAVRSDREAMNKLLDRRREARRRREAIGEQWQSDEHAGRPGKGSRQGV